MSDEDSSSAFPSLLLPSARVRRSSLPLNTHPDSRRPTPAHHAAIAEDPAQLRPPCLQRQRSGGASLKAGLEFGYQCVPLLDPGGRQPLPTRHRRKLSAPSARLYQVPESRDPTADGGGAGDSDGSDSVENVRRVIRVRRYHSLQVAR